MALIREAYPDSRRRAQALGIWAVGGAVAGAVGPLLGGLLTTIDWRLAFGINLPVCAGMLVLLRYVSHSPRRPAPFDWAGQALALITLGALIFGLIHGGAVGFVDPSVIIVLAVAAVGLVGFLAVEARARHPMMPLPLFHSAGLRIALAVGFAFMAGWFGTVFYVSLFLQQHLGLTPLRAGLVFLPAALFSVIGNVASGRLRNRYGPRAPAVAGQLSMVIGLVALLLTAPLGSPALTSVLLILIGPGGSVAMPVMTSVVLDSVTPERAGVASAVFNTFRQVGGAVAVAVFGALLANTADLRRRHADQLHHRRRAAARHRPDQRAHPIHRISSGALRAKWFRRDSARTGWQGRPARAAPTRRSLRTWRSPTTDSWTWAR